MLHGTPVRQRRLPTARRTAVACASTGAREYPTSAWHLPCSGIAYLPIYRFAHAGSSERETINRERIFSVLLNLIELELREVLLPARATDFLFHVRLVQHAILQDQRV